MLIKAYEISKKNLNSLNYFLIYGENYGLTKDLVKSLLELKEKKNGKYEKCKNINIFTYVDDCYGLIESYRKNLEVKINNFIQKMNKYYNNRLQNNLEKNKFMIISKSNEIKQIKLKLDGKIIDN